MGDDTHEDLVELELLRLAGGDPEGAAYLRRLRDQGKLNAYLAWCSGPADSKEPGREIPPGSEA